MQLIITLKKEVEDQYEGQTLFNQLKTLLSSVEGIEYHGRVTSKDLEQFPLEPPS